MHNAFYQVIYHNIKVKCIFYQVIYHNFKVRCIFFFFKYIMFTGIVALRKNVYLDNSNQYHSSI